MLTLKLEQDDRFITDQLTDAHRIAQQLQVIVEITIYEHEFTIGPNTDLYDVYDEFRKKND